MAQSTGNGGGDYKTFAGAGFGTMMVRLSAGPKETPTVASSRAYLRSGLPAIYQESDFGMLKLVETRVPTPRRSASAIIA